MGRWRLLFFFLCALNDSLAPFGTIPLPLPSRESIDLSRLVSPDMPFPGTIVLPRALCGRIVLPVPSRQNRSSASRRQNKIIDFWFVYMHYGTYTNMADDKNPSDVQRWFTKAVGGIWPVATGSLSLRKGPCIREELSGVRRREGP